MYAIPPRLEGGPDLVFECRVGHTYSMAELLVAKEERLHARLWTAYTALTELVALLDDLAAREGNDDGRRRYRERSEVARMQAAHLRHLIEDNAPLRLPADGEPS